MIYGNIKNWKELQNKVCELLNEVGLIAEKEKIISTPRGNVEIDVFAIDPLSVDKIKYIIECKNWNKKVSQTVIHAFTTVMVETGGNIGYIISKEGFQSGSFDYIKSTNIKLFSFEEFQNHYLEIWLERVFYKKVFILSEYLSGYTEPINSRRERYKTKLNSSKKEDFLKLFEYYQPLSIMLLMISNFEESPYSLKTVKKPKGISQFLTYINFFKKEYDIDIKSTTYSEFLIELEAIISKATQEFHDIFGKNIFLDLD